METYIGEDENVQVPLDILEKMHEAKQQVHLNGYEKINQFGKMHPKVFEAYETLLKEVRIFFVDGEYYI